MAEYIDKKALITEIQSAVSMVLQTAPYEKVWFDRFVDRQNEIMAIIERQPAAEVEPVRHGEWTKSEDDWNSLTTITCSECHEEWCFETEEDVSLLNYRYCPNCGARMDGGAENGK